MKTKPSHIVCTMVLVASCMSSARGATDIDKAALWSLQPIKTAKPPMNMADGNAIDAFILAQLRTASLSSSPADKRTLIRRLSFDLLGLPPSPEEVNAFIIDPDPCAYEKLVDHLLASPHYGERWARHWLDIAHYADTHGFERDQKREHAWPYRDYVIRAFNDDKPYDQFIREQIAGDVIAPENRDAIIATGFLAAGPFDFVGQMETPSPVLKRAARADDLDDIVTQVITSTMGLTINCARCHNHKLDPILQEDYYKLWSVFAGVKRGERDLGMKPKSEKLYAVVSGEVPVVKVLKRGNPEDAADEVKPGALSCFAMLPSSFGDNTMSEGARRKALAEWIVSKDNPQTARVMMNRLWHHHFGKGIVETPSDFGNGGSKPTHPELLDWLASEFMHGGWSVKRMQKMIVMSATYRQISSRRALQSDSSNQLLSRMNGRRLDAESLRDAVLSVSGSLNVAMGGPGYQDFEYQEAYAPIYKHITADRPELWRRSVYRFIVRTTPQRFMTTLDCPNPANLAPARLVTTTALQSLALMNNEFMVKQAGYFAERVKREAGEDATQQVEHAFALTFQRRPSSDELEGAMKIVRQQGLQQLCRLLLNANEFVYVD